MNKNGKNVEKTSNAGTYMGNIFRWCTKKQINSIKILILRECKAANFIVKTLVKSQQ